VFLSGDCYRKCMLDITSRGDALDVAVAFLGECADLLIAPKGVARVLCNLESGATNPAVVRELQKHSGIEVRTLADLHAKVILADHAAIVGSANLSANGLGFEGGEAARWVEAGTLVTEQSELPKIRAWFADLWSRATEIGPDQLAIAEAAWSRRRGTRPLRHSASARSGLFARLMEDHQLAKDRPLYLVAYRDHMSKEATNAFERWRDKQGFGADRTMECYENWDELPDDAYLIDIYCGPRGGVKPCGLYWTGPEKISFGFNYRGAGQGTVRVVFKQSRFEGLPVLRKELDEFVGRIRPYIVGLLEQTEANQGDNAFCIPVQEFMRQIPTSTVATVSQQPNPVLEPTR